MYVTVNATIISSNPTRGNGIFNVFDSLAGWPKHGEFGGESKTNLIFYKKLCKILWVLSLLEQYVVSHYSYYVSKMFKK